MTQAPGSATNQARRGIFPYLGADSKDVARTLDIFRFDWGLCKPTVGTRNGHWNPWVRFLELEIPSSNHKISVNIEKLRQIRDISTISHSDTGGLIQVPIEVFQKFAITNSDLKSLKQYLRAVRDRPNQPEMLPSDQWSTDQLGSTQRRSGLAAAGQPVNKAIPISSDSMRCPTGMQRKIAILVRSGGRRHSGLLGLQASAFPDRECIILAVSSNTSFLKAISDQDKCKEFTKFLPSIVLKYLTDDGVSLLPIQAKEPSLVLHAMGTGYTSHGFRRALALALRIQGLECGCEAKETWPPAIIERVGHIVGWKKSSGSSSTTQMTTHAFRDESGHYAKPQ